MSHAMMAARSSGHPKPVVMFHGAPFLRTDGQPDGVPFTLHFFNPYPFRKMDYAVGNTNSKLVTVTPVATADEEDWGYRFGVATRLWIVGLVRKWCCACEVCDADDVDAVPQGKSAEPLLSGQQVSDHTAAEPPPPERPSSDPPQEPQQPGGVGVSEDEPDARLRRRNLHLTN
jgi:hypothetical protein